MGFHVRRAIRVRNELRLWLRENCGVRLSYGKREIDHGKEVLGFDEVDDALVAYTFFGPDLLPDFVDSLDESISSEYVGNIASILADVAIDATDLVAGDESD